MMIYDMFKTLFCKTSASEYDSKDYLRLDLRLPRVSWWGVGTGKKNASRFQGISISLPGKFRSHTRSTIAQCARHDSDLTDKIVKMYAYPTAYGGFSDVWKCQLQCEQSPPESVAVKAIRPVIANEEELSFKKKAFERELSVWSGLEHQNIVPLYGITHEFGPLPAFVSPWAENGTLSEYLERFEGQLDMEKRMSLLSDIANGLHYCLSAIGSRLFRPVSLTPALVHARKIIHGDLSGSNVLITRSGRARLSDFGLSKLFERVSDTVASCICFPGNIRWAAPELFGEGEDSPQSRLSSQQADIYSFGSVMMQTLTGKLPFHGIQRVAQILIMISRGSRPPRERGWDGEAIPDVLWEFVERCWASPDERPSSKEVVSFIKSQRLMLR